MNLASVTCMYPDRDEGERPILMGLDYGSAALQKKAAAAWYLLL